MTTKLILINTDTHVVVPREPTPEMLDDIKYLDAITDFAMANRYKAMLSKAPQLTTPSVLRWEGSNLILGGVTVSSMLGGYGEWFLAVMGCHEGVYSTEQEARRAAEKALGLPIIEATSERSCNNCAEEYCDQYDPISGPCEGWKPKTSR